MVTIPRTWARTLDAAGITDPGLRMDYTRCARFAHNRNRNEYIAFRLMVPATVQPYVLAGLTFAAFTDDLTDAPPTALSQDRLTDWITQSRHAVAGGPRSNPLLRAYCHAVEVRGLPHHWTRRGLDGAETQLSFSGFTHEADISTYVDHYLLPLFMCGFGMLYQDGPSDAAERAWRDYGEFAQRLDFLVDLSIDLDNGRLFLPTDALNHHGVACRDLWQRRDTAAVRALLADLCDRALTAWERAHTILDLDSGPHRVLRAALYVHHCQLMDVRRAGAAILHRTIDLPLRSLPGAVVRAVAGADRQDASWRR
jgi:phytoene synthase